MTINLRRDLKDTQATVGLSDSLGQPKQSRERNPMAVIHTGQRDIQVDLSRVSSSLLSEAAQAVQLTNHNTLSLEEIQQRSGEAWEYVATQLESGREVVAGKPSGQPRLAPRLPEKPVNYTFGQPVAVAQTSPVAVAPVRQPVTQLPACPELRKVTFGLPGTAIRLVGKYHQVIRTGIILALVFDTRYNGDPGVEFDAVFGDEDQATEQQLLIAKIEGIDDAVFHVLTLGTSFMLDSYKVDILFVKQTELIGS